MAAVVSSEATDLPHVRALLVAARMWSAGAPLDHDAVGRARAAAVLDNHRRYLAGIPAYAALAEERGLTGDVTLDEVRAELVVTDELFKSYHPSWPDRDLPALTRWLGTISTTAPGAGAATDLRSWRAALREQGVFVTFSSGTTGQPSVVPRDRLTLASLRSGSGVRLPWALPAGRYDCLLLTPPGLGTGIQSGAAGLAAGAARVHTLHPTRPVPGHPVPGGTGADGDLEAVVAFLRDAA
ncbi:MAG TPA: hypothetical protein VGD67_20975, partial [Pseudonocardiaceae bacterium]